MGEKGTHYFRFTVKGLTKMQADFLLLEICRMVERVEGAKVEGGFRTKKIAKPKTRKGGVK